MTQSTQRPVEGADGTRLWCEARGHPADPALVLVMGATASSRWWPQALLDGLAAQRRFVICYDSRDTGQSTTQPPGASVYVIEDLVQDLFSVMDGFDIGSADLMGMSLGGYIAQIAALTHPARIRSLTLFASEPLGWTGAPLPGMPDGFLDHFGGMASLDWSDAVAVSDFLLGIARLSAGTGAPFDAAASLHRIRAEMAGTPSMQSAFNHASLACRDDWSNRAQDIRQPTLVLHGSDDPLLPPANGQALAQTIPGARLVLLDGVGHELPDRALPRILTALAGG